MINKIIIDDQNVELTDKSQVPYTHTFAQANTHVVRFGIDNTDEICAYAFQNCTELSYIAFPDVIKNIKRGAFKGCTSLERVPLSKNIEYIGKEAFDGCKNLKEIDFEHDNPPTTYCTFPSQTILYVPDGQKYEEVPFKSMNLDGKTEYFTQNPYSNKYEKIYDVSFCDENGTYFYNKWQDLGDDKHVVENKNRVPVSSIEFYDVAQVPKGGRLVMPYTLYPEDVTNTKLYWYSEYENVIRVNTDVPEENTVYIESTGEGNVGSVVNVTAYAESGVQFTGKFRLVEA